MKQKRGFTIVETLVAIAVLVTVITGAMYAIQTVLSSYISVKYESIATYLAQEGIEQIRSIRDENRLNGRDWLTGIAAVGEETCSTGAGCIVSPAEYPEARICLGWIGDCDNLMQSPQGFYGYNPNWTRTPFKRIINVTRIDPNTEVVVTATITWSQSGRNRQLVLRENLMNWQ